MDILVINQDNIIGFVAGCFTTVAVIFVFVYGCMVGDTMK